MGAAKKREEARPREPNQGMPGVNIVHRPPTPPTQLQPSSLEPEHRVKQKVQLVLLSSRVKLRLVQINDSKNEYRMYHPC